MCAAKRVGHMLSRVLTIVWSEVTLNDHFPPTHRIGHVAENLKEDEEGCPRVKDQLLQAIAETCSIEQGTSGVVLSEQTCSNLREGG